LNDDADDDYALVSLIVKNSYHKFNNPR